MGSKCANHVQLPSNTVADSPWCSEENTKLPDSFFQNCTKCTWATAFLKVCTTKYWFSLVLFISLYASLLVFYYFAQYYGFCQVCKKRYELVLQIFCNVIWMASMMVYWLNSFDSFVCYKRNKMIWGHNSNSCSSSKGHQVVVLLKVVVVGQWWIKWLWLWVIDWGLSLGTTELHWWATKQGP